jgi:hypothetical protein
MNERVTCPERRLHGQVESHPLEFSEHYGVYRYQPIRSPEPKLDERFALQLVNFRFSCRAGHREGRHPVDSSGNAPDSLMPFTQVLKRAGAHRLDRHNHGGRSYCVEPAAGKELRANTQHPRYHQAEAAQNLHDPSKKRRWYRCLAR